MENSEESLIIKLIRWWRGIPETVKQVIPPMLALLLKFLITIGIVMLALIIITLPVIKVNEIKDSMLGSGWSYKEIKEKTLNFFIYGSFSSREELLQNYEDKFYTKLTKVEEEYKKKTPPVNLDTVLLASTLLYEQSLFDEADTSIDENPIKYDNDTYTEDLGDSSNTEPNVHYYKKIINKIDDLAKYQIFTRKVSYACSDGSFRVETDPEDIFDVAMSNDGIQHVTSYYQNNPNELVPCKLDDVTTAYTNEYNKLKTEYDEKSLKVDEVCGITPPSGGGGGITFLPVKNEFSLRKIDTSINCVDARKNLATVQGDLYKISEYFEDDKFICKEPFKTGDEFDGCARLPSKTTETSFVDNKREGYYYYRISVYKKNGKTILEDLFPHMFEDLNESEKEIQNYRIIEGVYDLYEMFIENGFSSGLQVGEFFSIRTEGVENPTDPAYHLYWSNKNIFWTAGFNSQTTKVEPWAPGQCTTYVQGRVMEVEGEIGLTCGHPFNTVTGNASVWIDQNIANGSKFEYTYDHKAVRPGAVIVWGKRSSEGEGAGHVAFVEKVYQEEENGKLVTFVDFSEGNVGRGGENLHLDKQFFKYNKKISVDRVSKWGSGSGYYFKGYIYAICTDSLFDISTESSDD